MGPTTKILGLSFLLRDKLELDVLLIDPRSVALFAAELIRAPSFVLVSGPAGSSGSAYAALLQRIAFLQVDRLLVSSEDASLVDWSVRSDSKALPPRVDTLEMGEELDLRELLDTALARWGTA
jgi:hypothetical protein